MRPTTSHRSGQQTGKRKARRSVAPQGAVATFALAGAAFVLLSACSNSESGAAAAAGMTPAAQAPPPQSATPAAAAVPPVATAATAEASPADARRDPFAGVDPSQVDVLRNIARLDPVAAKAAARAPTAAPATPRSQRDESPVETAAPTSSIGTLPVTAGVAPASAPARTEVATAAPQTALPVAPPAALPVAPLGVPPAAPTPPTASAPAPVPSSTPAASPSTTATPAVAIAVPLVPAGSTAAGPAVPPSNLQRRALAQPQPAFPREALREGLNEGRVVALLSVAADGRVTDVAVLSSAPSRNFGRAAQQALRDWRYEPASAASSIRVELQFRAD